MIEAEHTYHAMYLALHNARAAAPLIWTDHHCARVLTSIMAAKLFSWRVVGITKAALQQLHQLNYHYQTGHGLTRAHLSRRIDTVRELLRRNEPLSEREFIEYWLTHDRTVICARGENKTIVPPFIQIETEDALLFSSNSVAWKHRKAERDLLKTLYERHFSGANELE